MTVTAQSTDRQPCIVIAEDHEDLRMVLLTELGAEFDVIEATNGEEGLRATLETMPDLVIADIMMPVMDGLALCQQIKTNDLTCHIPVVMLTAKSSQVHQIKGFEHGADDYITKPFDVKILKVRIRSLIETRRMLRKQFTGSSYDENSGDPEQTSEPNEFLQKVIEVIEAHMGNPDFGVVQLAGLLYANRTTLLNKIKTITELTPQEMIRSRRLHKAARLLEVGEMSISEIAIEIGIPEPSNFSRVFKSEFGVPPSKFRKG